MKLVAFLASFRGKGSESSCYTPVSTTPFLQSAMLLFTSIGRSLPTPAPYSDVLRNSPFLYFILLISTQVSREVICIFLNIFTPWLFTGRKISFSSVNHSDLKLRLAPITWFAIWLAPIVYACPLWLAGWSSRLYKWHLFYAFSSWREKECRWNLLPNIRMFRWAIQ